MLESPTYPGSTGCETCSMKIVHNELMYILQNDEGAERGSQCGL